LEDKDEDEGEGESKSEVSSDTKDLGLLAEGCGTGGALVRLVSVCAELEGECKSFQKYVI